MRLIYHTISKPHSYIVFGLHGRLLDNLGGLDVQPFAIVNEAEQNKRRVGMRAVTKLRDNISVIPMGSVD